AFDIYVSHVTYRTNHIIRILTVVSTVLLPVSVLVGFFGTGFRSVPALYGPGAFVVMLVLIATVMGAALFAVTRRGWI
ncbi:MAG: magnesium and cobalt transport protein CorA, partial [Chloroflexota bacterium]|nr:magnesium and cobalt transport protein CorA [Chloroflexota bacterium]